MAVGGDPEAEARLLRRRLSSRSLTRRRLRLAAVLGHEPARRVYEDTPKVRSQRFPKWVRAIRHYGGDEADLRVRIAVARACLPRWDLAVQRSPGAEGRLVRGDYAGPRELLALAEGCLASPPDPAAARDARRRGRLVADRGGSRASAGVFGGVLRRSAGRTPDEALAGSARAGAADVEGAWFDVARDVALASAHTAIYAASYAERGLGPFVDPLAFARRVVSEDVMRAAIQRELIAWALA
jgi:hypothetical protein